MSSWFALDGDVDVRAMVEAGSGPLTNLTAGASGLETTAEIDSALDSTVAGIRQLAEAAALQPGNGAGACVIAFASPFDVAFLTLASSLFSTGFILCQACVSPVLVQSATIKTTGKVVGIGSTGGALGRALGPATWSLLLHISSITVAFTCACIVGGAVAGAWLLSRSIDIAEDIRRGAMETRFNSPAARALRRPHPLAMRALRRRRRSSPIEATSPWPQPDGSVRAVCSCRARIAGKRGLPSRRQLIDSVNNAIKVKRQRVHSEVMLALQEELDAVIARHQ